MNTPAKGYIVIRNNRLVASTHALITALDVARTATSKDHTTVWNLDTMQCVGEYHTPVEAQVSSAE